MFVFFFYFSPTEKTYFWTDPRRNRLIIIFYEIRKKCHQMDTFYSIKNVLFSL